MVDTWKKVKLKDINLNVAICTYDSVTYRLNIYQSEDQTEYKNILTSPVYISFSKDEIKKVITFDLSHYSTLNTLLVTPIIKRQVRVTGPNHRVQSACT
jgi:hypothetical protein